jgi:DNA-binding transcriptional regulator YdaS (Cro superfamily)
VDLQDGLLTTYKAACLLAPMSIQALRHIIRRHLKSQTATARVVGVSPQAVSEILRRGKRVPAEWCLKLEAATHGAVSAHDLRPDLYPAPATLPAAPKVPS